MLLAMTTESVKNVPPFHLFVFLNREKIDKKIIILNITIMYVPGKE
jgi:hypothetical protein